MIAAVVVALLAVAVLAYVAAPMRARDEPSGEGPEEVAEIEGRKRAALTAILDMEEERDAGKLTADDFAALRGEYEAEAAAALLELDALRTSDADEGELEAEIAAIRTRLQETPRGRARAAEPCPSCGAPRVPGRTCARCGA